MRRALIALLAPLVFLGACGDATENAVDVVIEVYSSSDGSGDPIETINTTWVELAAMQKQHE